MLWRASGQGRGYSSAEDQAFTRLRSGKDSYVKSDEDFKGWRCCVGVLAFLVSSIVLLTVWHLKVISTITTPLAGSRHHHNHQHMTPQHHALPQHSRSTAMCVPPETIPSTGGDALPALSARLGESKLLVFEVGTDAEYWLASNCAGPTLFLQAGDETLAQHPRSVQMQTRYMQSDVVDATPEMLEDSHLLTTLAMNRIPKEVTRSAWDEILVESGGASNLNIFAARRLAGPTTSVFVDDCQHTERSAFLRHWFAKDGVDVSIYDNGRGGMMCRAGPGIPPFGSSVTREASPASWLSMAVFAGCVMLYGGLMCWMRMNALDKVGMKL